MLFIAQTHFSDLTYIFTRFSPVKLNRNIYSLFLRKSNKVPNSAVNFIQL